MSCKLCGYGFHRTPLTEDALRGFYNEDYSLGQHDLRAEQQRAQAYGTVVAELLDEAGVPMPDRFLEFGCGMGSLLAWLQAHWGSGSAFGIEPSDQLAAVAGQNAAEGVEVLQGFAEDLSAAHVGAYDLCLSVNVVEHTLSPQRFLETCRKAIRPNGSVIVVCPDGETPGTELLFLDHVSSFTQASMSFFAQRAGLQCVTRKALAGPLLGFQMFLLKPGTDPSLTANSPSALSERRANFLNTWLECEAAVGARLNGQPYAIFGVGEYADLLTAYAPGLVAGAECFVADDPQMPDYAGKRVLTTDAFLRLKPVALLAAVNERSRTAVEARFRDRCPDVFHPTFL
ncbi:MAG: class I SAM-dependent methyltransferase [Pseudomonadota bacterium]